MQLRSFTRALLVLNLLYCVLAAAQEGLPGWHMFESVDRVDFSLRDRNGADVDVRAYLPKHAALLDDGEARAVVRFVCEKERARAPFSYVDRTSGLSATIGPDDCRVHAPR